jgi:hypothetical protein
MIRQVTLLLNCPSELGCAGLPKDLMMRPHGLAPNTFVRLGFLSARSHPFFAARVDKGRPQAVLAG